MMQARRCVLVLVALALPAGASAQTAVAREARQGQRQALEPSAPGPWSGRLVGPRARAELRHPDPALRLEAARALGRWGEPHRAVAALGDALETEEDARVRSALFDALARRGDEAAVPRLAQRLGDLGREDRAAALHAIGAIGGESAIRVLAEWLSAPDVGDDAARALVRVGAPAVPHMLRALRLSASIERAARVLGSIGDARATPALTGALDAAQPTTRIAVIEALAALGDERAAPVVAQALSDRVPLVVEAAVAALGQLGGPELAPPNAELADRGTPEQRALAIEALVRMSPGLAAPRVEAILADDQGGTLRGAAVGAIVAHPARELVPALAAASHDEAIRAQAADALARVPNGAGMEALVELAPSDGALLALALGVRRHEAVAGGATLARARALLGDGTSLESALALALARDPRALAPLVRALSAPEPLARAQAAIGLTLLGPLADGARDALAAQLAVEDDARAFRAMAAAAGALRLSFDAARLDARWWSAETAPEALWIAAASQERAGPRARRRTRRAMRRALRAIDPRVRAGAALALARAHDHAAWRALVAALEDEHDAVRLAAAHALGSLAVRAAREPIASRERVERDPRVRAALHAALAGGRPPPAALSGREVLLVRVVTAPGLRERAPDEPIEVDVLLPDGRWLRTFTLAGGMVVLPDLPGGEAEVQVRI